MATEKQTAANRLNAQKSTGPRTPEGRAAVRLNGVTHGLTAETLVLKGESEDDFNALFESLEAEHQPETPTEETLDALATARGVTPVQMALELQYEGYRDRPGGARLRGFSVWEDDVDAIMSQPWNAT